MKQVRKYEWNSLSFSSVFRGRKAQFPEKHISIGD